MVRSDLGASGVAFSLDTESGFKDVVVINGSYGLGEMVVQGSVSPDEFIVFKPAMKEGYASIIEKKLGVKDQMMVYGDDPDERVLVHHEEFGDRLLGVLAGFLLYGGLVNEGPHAIVVLERLTGRQLGSIGREIVAVTVSESIVRRSGSVPPELPKNPPVEPEVSQAEATPGRKANA